MRIRTTEKGHVLTRYAGVTDGKSSAEAKLGVVPLGTAPDAIADETSDNLTRKEQRQLVDFLRAQEVLSMRKTLIRLTEELNSIASVVDVQNLAGPVVDELLAALSRASVAVLHVQRMATVQGTGPDSSRETVVASTGKAAAADQASSEQNPRFVPHPSSERAAPNLPGSVEHVSSSGPVSPWHALSHR